MSIVIRGNNVILHFIPNQNMLHDLMHKVQVIREGLYILWDDNVICIPLPNFHPNPK